MLKVSLMPALRRFPASITRRYAPAVPPARRVLPLAAALLAVAAPATAQTKGTSIYQSKLLWATVNICDTRANPDTVGIRGSMPGSGFANETMHMRFQLQYFDQKDKEWHNLPTRADTGFVPVGKATFKQRQAGRNFVVPPPATGAFILRGAVTFEWRDKKGEVVRRARKRTTSNHGPTAGADPKGFSAAKCEVRAS
jgi:hypothetical protein